MIEAPALLHAADGVCRASQAAKDRKDKPGRGAQVREPGDQRGDGEAGEDDKVAANQGADARVEDGRGHGGSARAARPSWAIGAGHILFLRRLEAPVVGAGVVCA